ncbi:hypothetical protein [Actinopolyspora saharensis]|uniref:hypothetical protein n=1 Tax=Actinopolyspora saharensis TaxID=995062 RepID=UPI000ACA7A35|nr:hypothetical protein [Actinopolyspora saharensis]
MTARTRLPERPNVFIAVLLDRRTKICRYVDGAPFTVNVLTEPQDKVALHDPDKQDVLTTHR